MAKNRLERGGIIERWDSLVIKAQGQGDTVLINFRRLIDESNIPGVVVEQRKLAAGSIQGVLGGKRPFLVIRHTVNPHLKAFKMLINVREYGTNLHVSWFLVHQPSWWSTCMNFILTIPIISLLVFPFYFVARLIASREAGVLELNSFDEQDLRGYVTFIHHCLVDAVEGLNHDDEIDTSSLHQHSMGFLGIV